MVSALIEDATSSSLSALVIMIKQTDDIFKVDVDKIFSSESKYNVYTLLSANMLSLIFPLFRHAKDTKTTLASKGSTIF